MKLSKQDIDFYLAAFKEFDITNLFKLLNLAESRQIAANEIYIYEGSTSKKLAYIKRGLIRTYILKPTGEEITLMVRWENQFIASIDSVLLNRSSRFIYQALEDTVVLEIDYDKIQPIVNSSPSLSSSRNNFLMDMLAQAMDRIEAFVLLSPEERYVKLLEEKHDIINRVPGKYLATMLGITPVSLSRIRARIARGDRKH